MSKHYKINLVSYFQAYSVEDIVFLCSVDSSTVRRWMKKEGLMPIDAKQPFLIYGQDLKNFLGTLNSKNKHKLDIQEMFCTKCQIAQLPYKRKVFLEEHKSGFLKLKGICPKCKAIMNINRSIDDYQKLMRCFDCYPLDKLELFNRKVASTNEQIFDRENKGKSVLVDGQQLGLFMEECDETKEQRLERAI